MRTCIYVDILIADSPTACSPCGKCAVSAEKCTTLLDAYRLVLPTRAYWLLTAASTFDSVSFASPNSRVVCGA